MNLFVSLERYVNFSTSLADAAIRLDNQYQSIQLVSYFSMSKIKELIFV